MENDMNIPERFEFHDWYKKEYGEEYPYGYTEMFRILSGREKSEEREAVSELVDKFNRKNIGWWPTLKENNYDN